MNDDREFPTLPLTQSTLVHEERKRALQNMDYSTRTLCEATGTTNEDSAQYLYEQLMVTLPDHMSDVYTIEINRTLLKEISPNDPLEGMLAIQMLALHNHAIDQVGASKKAKTLELEQAHLKNAMALSNLFGKQLERLNSYRKKGNQTIQVQHVNVNSGGQAIVGNIQQNGGGER